MNETAVTHDDYYTSVEEARVLEEQESETRGKLPAIQELCDLIQGAEIIDVLDIPDARSENIFTLVVRRNGTIYPVTIGATELGWWIESQETRDLRAKWAAIDSARRIDDGE